MVPAFGMASKEMNPYKRLVYYGRAEILADGRVKK
jgi:hypothetical protein